MNTRETPEELYGRQWSFRMADEYTTMMKSRSRYSDTDIARLPKAEFDQACTWDAARGENLILCGPTGTGKTRIAGILVKRWMTQNGYRCRWIPETEMAIEVGDKAMHGKVGDYLDPLCSCAILFIDDLGKAPPTERFVSSLYHIVESRHAAKKPIICTTQLTAEELKAKLGSRDQSESHALAIFRRLSEEAMVIKISK